MAISDLLAVTKCIFDWPHRRMDVSSRNSVSRKFDFWMLTPPASVSEATSHPSPVTARTVADDLSSAVEKSGAWTRKRTESFAGKLSSNALRNGSGASWMASSFVGRRSSIFITIRLSNTFTVCCKLFLDMAKPLGYSVRVKTENQSNLNDSYFRNNER